MRSLLLKTLSIITGKTFNVYIIAVFNAENVKELCNLGISIFLCLKTRQDLLMAN